MNVVIAILMENYVKWQETQLTTYLIKSYSEVKYFDDCYEIGELCGSSSMHS